MQLFFTFLRRDPGPAHGPSLLLFIPAAPLCSTNTLERPWTGNTAAFNSHFWAVVCGAAEKKKLQLSNTPLSWQNPGHLLR